VLIIVKRVVTRLDFRALKRYYVQPLPCSGCDAC
jgi:hypothetical protein